jgi:Transposase IS200 like.
MSIRKIQFTEGYYYHVFNRGVDKRDLFKSTDDLYYFFNRLSDLNSTIISSKFSTQRSRKNGEIVIDKKYENLVSIISYCILPNHFHLILKQESENGISKFMQKLGTSYTMYFNKKIQNALELYFKESLKQI